jgi:ketosteroid isomerase-like protein
MIAKNFPSRVVAVAVLSGGLLPACLIAQIPGASSVDVDVEAAKFRAYVLEQVRPVMESWEDAWRGENQASIERHYATDAVLAAPDGSVLGGREQIARFIQSVPVGTRAINASMLDFEPTDRMAYVYGSWSKVQSSNAPAASGRFVTMLLNEDEQWLIRSQLFAADSLSATLLPSNANAEPLPPIAGRIAPDASASGNTDSRSVQAEQRRRATEIRRSAYSQLTAAFAALRRAWTNDDVKAVTGLMRDDAMLQPPGHGPFVAKEMLDELTRTLTVYGTLNTVELDFELSASLAYLSGRYYIERRVGGPRIGTYIAVFKNGGSGWLIRSLVFS